MSTIPHLSTLGAGSRRRTRLRGQGGRNEGDVIDPDSIIQQTDCDASNSRISAVALGYLDDKFAKEFSAPGDEPQRRYPIINRGTYVRTTAIDQLAKSFLRTTHDGQRKQIISLGAGSDTRFWRLWKESNHQEQVDYYEFDFEPNVSRKRSAIQQSSVLSSVLVKAREGGWNYHLHALDLRQLAGDEPPNLPDISINAPTLLLSECCLCYVDPDSAMGVLKYFTTTLQGPCSLILYEPIRPFDAFGKTMVSNLGSRKIHLQTLKRYGTLEAQRQRLRLSGFIDGQGARDVLHMYQDDAWVSPDERARLEKLEWLDEVEEWKLLASHYCVAWGWRGEVFGRAWEALEGGRTDDERDE
ncbi:leucine carboxyl methyltransferase [Piedraia hortae CBS 480.64]|uniref:Leucine carboxyl methyltransferase 1 n=1 Tax=Piedraia hortae CBS 480.64 TaxID=1314780 RepID=A0A6A7BWA3_9PEZI|nr:leucine carboxyl methyltransferase [Piedraia hortae CBS 480.64]